MTQHRNKCTSEKSVASFFWLLSKESFTHQLKPPVVHQLFHQLSWTKGICSKIDPNDALGTLVKLFICCKIFRNVQTAQKISHFDIVRFMNNIVRLTALTELTKLSDWRK